MMDSGPVRNMYIYTYICIYLLTEIWLSPGGNKYLHTNNT